MSSETEKKPIKDKVALVTGASSGIGRATALAFATKGARVAVAARRQEASETLVAEIEELGGEALAIATDVSKAADIERMVAATMERFGRLDYAVNNAGYVASKHALIGLTSSVSAELAPSGIRVNLVCPGIIKTPMHQRLRDTIGDEIYDVSVLPTVHLQRAGEPGEIARTILFLCSPKRSCSSRFVERARRLDQTHQN